MKLQGFGISESQYERPNQSWICGRAAAGDACRIGPDAKGQCRAKFECAPIEKDGRWQCTRPPLYGGPCGNGPLPSGTCSRPIPRCQPVRSLRAKRGLLAVWTSLATVGLLAFALGSRNRTALLSPGDLGFQHGKAETVAPLSGVLTVPAPVASSPATAPAKTAKPKRAKKPPVESASGGGRCGDCHAARHGLLGPLAAVFGLAWGPPQSELCLRCHTLGKYALKAHSLSPAVLAPVTASLAGTHPSPAVAPDWQCATCHIEHQGRSFPIDFMDNRRCQACHARTFDSLASGHPEFRGYPYGRGLHLKFDHNKHKSEYFLKARNGKEDRAFKCGSCHVPDSSGRYMLVRSFEQTCAECHASQIADNDGIPFLTVPGFDPQGLRGSPARIGEWPNQYETDLSPFMRLLLAGGPDKAAYLENLKGVDPLDLQGASKGQFEAVAQYAWSVKRLLIDLSVNGQDALRIRLENALFGKDTGSNLVKDLVGEIPPAVIDRAIRAWFPHLQAEDKALSEGGLAPATKFLGTVNAKTTEQPKQWLKEGGWYVNDEDFTVRYRPAHHADLFVRSWLEVAAGLRDHPDARRVLDALGKPTSPGRCMKCHTLGPAEEPGSWSAARFGAGGPSDKGGVEATGPEVVRWNARRASLDQRGFTKFSHTTHLNMLGQVEGCADCHLLAVDAPPAILQSSLMAKASGDFVPIQKARCLTCHVRKAAGDNCVLCHNYHVGSFAAAWTAGARAALSEPKSAVPTTGQEAMREAKGIAAAK